MKKLFFSTLFCILWAGLIAQTPQAFKYQAVARDASGIILANKNVTDFLNQH